MNNTKLTNLRKEKGYSLIGMAKLLGIGTSTYCQFESGVRTVPANVAHKISEILCVEFNDIFLPTRFTISEQKAENKEEGKGIPQSAE